MNTEELLLWKEYTKEVKLENDLRYTKWRNMDEKFSRQRERLDKTREEIYEAQKQKMRQEQIEWEKLPWYKKLFKEEPFWWYIPRPLSLPMLFSSPILQSATYEQFLNWQVKRLKKTI